MISDIVSQRKLNNLLASIESAVNALGNAQFSSAAQISASKFADDIVTRDHVSTTHAATTALSRLTSLDQYGNVRNPMKFGNVPAGNYVSPDYANGGLVFVIPTAPYAAVVDAFGWTSGAPASVPATKFEIEYDPVNSWFSVLLDGTTVAWVDCLNVAGVFVDSEPGGTRTESTGEAAVDFSSGTRIDFINNGVVVGYIDATGTHEGTP